MSWNDPAVFGLLGGAGLGATIASILYTMETELREQSKVYPRWALVLFIFSAIFLLLKLKLLYNALIWFGYGCIFSGFILLLIFELNYVRGVLLLVVRRVRKIFKIPPQWYD